MAKTSCRSSQLVLDIKTEPAKLMRNCTIAMMEERKCMTCGGWFYILSVSPFWNCMMCLFKMGLIPANIRPNKRGGIVDLNAMEDRLRELEVQVGRQQQDIETLQQETAQTERQVGRLFQLTGIQLAGRIIIPTVPGATKRGR